MTYNWEVVVRLRPTIFVAVLALTILSQPTQIVELYLIDIEAVLGRLSGSNLQFMQVLIASSPMAIPVGLSLLAVLVLWLASMHLVSLAPDYEQWPRSKTVFANAVALAAALSPLGGLIAGLHAAQGQLPRIELKDPSELNAALSAYTWAAYVLLAVSACVLIVLSIFAATSVKSLAHGLFRPSGILAVLLTPILITLAVLVAPTTFPSALGTIPIVLLFIAVLALLLASFSHIYRRTGWPVTAMAAAAAVVFAALGWNDNHKVDYSDGGPALYFQSGFNEWLQQRGDLGYFAERKQPYPVYIIAAEGGGMSAGYHLASFLARLQEACPTFAQHVFAISSVSGGSLGAAQFAAQVNTSVKNGPWQPCGELGADGEHSRNAREFFRTDFLSPVVAAALFPDLLQRILPFPVTSLDRARGLESAFTAKAADIWGSRGTANPFSKSVHKLWDPAGAAPALLLNTTSIEMGARVTISPLLFGVTPTALDLGILMCDGGKAIEIPLAKSVSLSARAPWITPAGWLEKNETWPKADCGETPRQSQKPDGAKRNRLYLVDGGYFENSGLETALEIATQLRAQARECQKAPTEKEEQRKGALVITIASNCSEAFKYGVEIRTIMIFAKDSYAEQFWGPFADLSSSRPSELLAPLRTLLNTGSARTRAVHIRQSSFDDDYTYVDSASSDRILENLNRYRIPGERFLGTNELHHVMLDGTRFFLPLGWRLSRRSMDNIQSSDSEATRLTFAIIRRELMGEDTIALKRPPKGLTR